MRRNHFNMPDSVSPNTASPPRLRQRMSSATMLQQLTASIAAQKRSTYYNITESAAMQNIRNPWDTETHGKPWAYKTVSDDESSNNSDSEDRYDNNEFRAISTLNRNRIDEENYLGYNELNVFTDEDFLPPIQGYMHISPQSEDEYDHEPPLMADNEDTLKQQFGFCPIPEDLLCDEGVSFKYNDNGNYETGNYECAYVDDNVHNYADYDDVNPTTSRRALEKLFILQTSIWMELPNIVSVVKVERATVALSKSDRRQISLGYISMTL